MAHVFVDGYCSTVQGLLDWFEVDLGFTELSFIQIDLPVSFAGVFLIVQMSFVVLFPNDKSSKKSVGVVSVGVYVGVYVGV